jgi:hypothetical protein
MSKEDELIWETTKGTHKFVNIALVKPRIVIHNAGEFFVNDNNKLDFEGDTEEAGRLFAEYVCKCYNKYIENLLAEERKKVIQERIDDAQKDYEELWKDIIEKDDCVDIEKLKLELSDFRYIIKQLPKIYMHITNGILSKHMYSAETIISLHDDIRTQEIEEAIAEERKKVAEEIEANFKKRVGISTEKAIQYLDRLKDIRIPIRNPKYIKESE